MRLSEPSPSIATRRSSPAECTVTSPRSFLARPNSDFDIRLKRRKASRLLLLDEEDRVLLLRHVPPLHDLHWAGIGGGVEPNEGVIQALVREAHEESNLRFEASTPRPCGDWRHVYRYRGQMVVQLEHLYWMRAPASYEPELGPAAGADGIDRAQWFSAEQLVTCANDVWPTGLADWLRLSDHA